MFSSLICFYLFFLYISFWTFFGEGITPASQRGVKQCNQNIKLDIYGNTALPLAPDLQKPSNPTYSKLSSDETVHFLDGWSLKQHFAVFLVTRISSCSLGRVSSSRRSRSHGMRARKPSIRVGWLRPTTPLASGVSSRQAYYCFGKDRFIVWYLRQPFLWECWWGSKHFGNRPRIWASVRARPPKFKNAMSHTLSRHCKQLEAGMSCLSKVS